MKFDILRHNGCWAEPVLGEGIDIGFLPRVGDILIWNNEKIDLYGAVKSICIDLDKGTATVYVEKG